MRWLVGLERANHANREAGMTMRWRLTAAKVSRCILAATNQQACSWVLLWMLELEVVFESLPKNQGREERRRHVGVLS